MLHFSKINAECKVHKEYELYNKNQKINSDFEKRIEKLKGANE